MKKLVSRISISAQLILLLSGFTVLITLVLAGVLNHFFTQRIEEAIGGQFAELAIQTTDKLDRSLFERYREVQLLANKAQLSNVQVSFQEKRRVLEEMQNTLSFYAWLGITDNKGQVLVSANKLLEGVNVSKRPWFGNALKGKHLTDVHDAKLLSKLLQPESSELMRVIDIAFPYRDGEGNVAGVFGAHLSLAWADEIEKSILSTLQKRKQVEALIVSENMSVIIGPKKLIGKTLSLPDIASAPAVKAGYVVEQFADGKTYLVGYSKSQGYSNSPNLKWTVLVRQDIDGAYAPAIELQRQIILAGFGIAGLFALLGFLLARRVSKPLCLIAESARKIESGESTSIAEINGGYREIKIFQAALQSLIDKLQANESSLKLAEQRKDEFLATLAHELRNPLAPISAIGDLLSMSHANADQQRRLGETISRQIQHMTGLIDGLLDVSRITRGVITIDRRPVSMLDVIAEALEQVHPLIKAQGHHFETRLPPTCVMVAGDRRRLVQVVANLLDNAVKYTPNGGRIVLTLSEEDGRVVLSLLDNGIGMSASLIEHAFELFTQATRKTDRSKGGLGVGLALSKSLVQLHDGTLTVTSGGVGQGSEFVVSLPALDHRSETIQPAGDQIKQLPKQKYIHVLIVDDNVDAANTLGMLVESLGYDVLIEHFPEGAIEVARFKQPQICLLDIGMPTMDGCELAIKLRELPGMHNAAMIAVTGYGQARDKEKAVAAEFNAYFVKPIETKELQKCLAFQTNARQVAMELSANQYRH